MKIEYNRFGDVQLEINKHREVLHPSRNDGEGVPIAETDVSGKPAIVQAVFNAMKAVPTTGEHRLINFDSATGIINADGVILTPDSDVSSMSLEVQTFFNTIYASENAPAVRLFRNKQIINGVQENAEA